jgi:hypothetical protein
MAKMDMKMGAHALKYRPKKDERFKIKEEYMQMDMSKDPAMKGMDMNHSKMEGGKGRHQEANGYAQGSCKGRMEWIILRWKG